MIRYAAAPAYTIRRTLAAVAIPALLAGPCLAQQHAVDRGVWQIGGTVGAQYSARNGADEHSWSVDLSPSVGYFVAPGLAVGLSAGKSWSHYTRTNPSFGTVELNGSSWSLGPAAAYYFGSHPARVHPFLGGRAGYGEQSFSSSSNSSASSESRAKLLSAQLDGGVLWLLARNVGVTGSLYYRWLQIEQPQALPPPAPATSKTITREMGFLAGVSVHVY